LVSEPHYLRTYGIFNPDNLITIVAETTATVFGLYYFILRDSMIPPINVSPELFQQTLHYNQIGFPVLLSGLISFLVFVVACGTRTGHPLPRDEAKYLDGKVIEFYK